jgi:hypothetical protein
MRFPSRRSAGVLVAAASVSLIVACTSGALNTDSGNGNGSVATASNNNAGNPPAPHSVIGNKNADISVPDGLCAWLVHNANNHSGRAEAFVAMPGTDFYYGENFDVWFTPGCGEMGRDLIIGTGILKNAIDESVGDREIPAPGDGPAYTKDGVPVYVALRVDWFLNQNEVALGHFWRGICVKFSCATHIDDPSNPPVLGPKSSTPGWLRWQGELLAPTIDDLVNQFMNNYDSRVIKDYGMKQNLGTDMSTAFSKAFTNITGEPGNLLCAPGTSHWANLAKGDYDCEPVRITVRNVIPASELDFGRFGNLAHQVAAAQAIIDRCKQDGLQVCPLGSLGSIAISTKAKVTGVSSRNRYALAA